MTCGQSKRFCLCWLCLALLLAPATLWADDPLPESSEPSASASESSPSGSQITASKLMQLPPEFWTKWNEYNIAFQSLALSLDEFLDQVEAFGINFEQLPSFIAHLIDSYESSEEARLREREAAAAAIYQAEQARDRWRAVSMTAAGAAAGALVAGPVGAAVGAAVGLAIALLL